MENKVYRLDELCDIKSGKRIPKDMDFVTFETEHPYIRARDIKKGKINTDDLIYLEDYVFQKIKRYIINSGDIAITIVGASVGDTGYASENVDGYNLTENAVRLTNYKNNVDSKFLHYVLSQKQYHDYMQLIAGAAAQPKLGIYKVKRIKVELPNLEKQKKIADILTTYDNLIENNNKRIKLLEQMAENLYKEWFVRFRFPGYENSEFENGIPKGWTIKKIKNFGQVITGKTPSTEISSYYGEKYLFIKTPDMHDNMYVIDSSEKLSELGNEVQKLKKLPAWSIMVSCIGTGGVVSINSKEAHTNQQINSIVLHDEKQFEWLFFVCKSLKTTIEMFGATGSTMTNLSKGKFENLKILEPNLELVNKFHMYTHDMFKEIEKLMFSNKNLINQRDLLLPRLMSGKLEV